MGGWNRTIRWIASTIPAGCNFDGCWLPVEIRRDGLSWWCVHSDVSSAHTGGHLVIQPDATIAAQFSLMIPLQFEGISASSGRLHRISAVRERSVSGMCGPLGLSGQRSSTRWRRNESLMNNQTDTPKSHALGLKELSGRKGKENDWTTAGSASSGDVIGYTPRLQRTFSQENVGWNLHITFSLNDRHLIHGPNESINQVRAERCNNNN